MNKKLYRAFSQQANGLTLNILVLQGLLRVNRKVEKEMHKVDKTRNYKCQCIKQRKSKEQQMMKVCKHDID